MDDDEEEEEDGPSGVAGPSRHPALPKESWQTVFPLHFVAYKKVSPFVHFLLIRKGW
jgi:hypothetical protein